MGWTWCFSNCRRSDERRSRRTGGAPFPNLLWARPAVFAYRARDRLTSLRPLPSRRRLYVSTLLQLTFFLVLALLAAWAERLSLWRWPQHVFVPSAVTAALLVLMIISTRPVRRSAVSRRELRVYFTMPAGLAERALWIALSLMAGIAEETVYRGVFSDLATRLTGSTPLAWGLAAAAFAIAHANQGSRQSPSSPPSR